MQIPQPALAKLLIYAKIDTSFLMVDQMFGDPDELQQIGYERKTNNPNYLVVLVTYTMEDAIVLA